jgi:hypothetical protein
MTEDLPMPTYSIDPLYPHWFRCDLRSQDVAEVLPAGPFDLVNLTPAHVLGTVPRCRGGNRRAAW